MRYSPMTIGLITVTLTLNSQQGALSAPAFSAECTDKAVHAYRYYTGLDGSIAKDYWSKGEKFNGKWTFIYTGGKYLVIDNEKIHIVAEVQNNLVAIDPTEGFDGASVWSYAINLDVKKIVAAQVQTDGPFLGSGVKTRSVELECEFTMKEPK